jgi:hypothetical protein
VIAGLVERRGDLQQFASHSRALFLERYNWGLMEVRLAEMYRALDRD